MLLPLLPLLKGTDWKRVGAAAALLAVLALGAYCYLQHVALGKLEAIYAHPRTEERIQMVRIVGPVRIVTRVVEIEGKKETIIEEVRGPIVETSDSLKVAEPVFPPAPRTDRWLAGASLDPFSYADTKAWTAYGGYSFRNRLDLCAGISGRGQGRVLVMVRF